MNRFRVGSATDKGQIRNNNQDSNLVADARHLYAVADGMGGHQGGEVASAIAVETLAEAVTASTVEGLLEAVHLANARIYEQAAGSDDLRGMGTTLVAIALVGEGDAQEIAWVNVGDSRVYLYRDDVLSQLSRDHSLVEDLKRGGQLSDEEAAIHPQRNILTRALGIDSQVEVDSSAVVPLLNDRFLLCSDGLFNEVTVEGIVDALATIEDPTEAANTLVRQANDNGGRDNITCVVVDVVDDGGRAAATTASAPTGKGAKDPVPTAELPAVGAPDEDAVLAAEPVTVETPPPPPPSPTDTGPDAPTAPTAPVDSSDAPTVPTAAALGARANRDDDLPFGRNTRDIYGDLDQARGRHIVARILVALIALVVLGAVAVGIVGWNSRRSYYVTAGDAQVEIFRGRPGGVLMFDPTLSQRTNLAVDDLTADDRARLTVEPTFSSIGAARAFVNGLRDSAFQAEAGRRATTTTTTRPTTTLRPTTTIRPTTTTRPGATTVAPGNP